MEVINVFRNILFLNIISLLVFLSGLSWQIFHSWEKLTNDWDNWLANYQVSDHLNENKINYGLFQFL